MNELNWIQIVAILLIVFLGVLSLSANVVETIFWLVIWSGLFLFLKFSLDQRRNG